MKNKKIDFSLSIVLVIIMMFCTLNINSYAADDQKSEIFLYGFGDDYEGDDFLTLYNTKTCYVSIRNIPISEKENIRLTVKDEDIAEIQEIVYGDDSNPVITAKIKGKKLGTTDIIASLTYNGDNYTSRITTTVHESNYHISLRRDIPGGEGANEVSMNKNESMKLVAMLFRGTSSYVGDISSNGAIWSSNNENVASVDNNGLVTGIGKGTATITAKYQTNEGVTINASCNIEVKDENNSSEEAKIRFYYDDPGPSMVLNNEDKFNVGLENIPQTEKENIKFIIENENIAQVTKIEYDKSWADAVATVKYLSVGNTKLIATLDYNGKTYSTSYDLNVTDYTKSPENPGISSEPTSPSSSNNPTTKSDPTTVPIILPKTGKSTILMMTIGIIIFISMSLIMYKKHKNYKDIR